MTAPVKFLFDECISDLAMKEIADVVRLSFDGFELKHIKEYWQLGSNYQDWLPLIANEKGWIIISADRSKRKSKGEKLKTVCKLLNITLVEISQKIHHLQTSSKAGIIITMWPELMKLADAPPGSRHLLKLKSNKPHSDAILIQIEPPPVAPIEFGEIIDPT